MKILVPTCRAFDEIEEMCSRIMVTAPDCELFPSCLKESAAKNRNFCLNQLGNDPIAIMLDDDISGFYPGWVNDLIAPIVADPSVVMVSARLLNPDGSFGPTCSRCYDPEPEEIEIFSNGGCILPTAAIAFRWVGIYFDEHFIGSGFEDSDWCMQYLQTDPTRRFIQSNRCRLIHRNEMKNQKGKYWHHNQAYYFHKWRPVLSSV